MVNGHLNFKTHFYIIGSHFIASKKNEGRVEHKYDSGQSRTIKFLHNTKVPKLCQKAGFFFKLIINHLLAGGQWEVQVWRTYSYHGAEVTIIITMLLINKIEIKREDLIQLMSCGQGKAHVILQNEQS